MKKIAKDLEIAFTDFLGSDILSKNWNYKAGPDKWSKKEIIGHLIDSAQINLQRFVRSTYTENFKVSYDQVEWVNAQHYGAADINELLELWRLLNKQIVRVLENYPLTDYRFNAIQAKHLQVFTQWNFSPGLCESLKASSESD
jgi:hypothetical protein